MNLDGQQNKEEAYFSLANVSYACCLAMLRCQHWPLKSLYGLLKSNFGVKIDSSILTSMQCSQSDW